MADPAATTSNPDNSAPSVRTPEIFDPYLGTAYGNILDLYDNPTYNIKVALVRDRLLQNTGSNSTGQQQTDPGDTTAAQDRTDTPTDSSSDTPNSGPTGSNLGPPVGPGDMIVIAQTGVTGILIDNVTMTTGLDPSVGVWPTRIEFQLIQPGMANLIDQIQIGRKWLDTQSENRNAQFLMLFEISFTGRKADPEDEDLGGQPTVVDGPYGWICTTNAIDIKVDQTGSTYNFKLTPYQQIVYNDRDYRTPHEIQCTGTTLKDSINNFQTALNDSLRKNKPSDYTDSDEYFFDTSRLLGSAQPLLPENAQLRSPADPDMNQQSAISSGTTRAELEAEFDAAFPTLVNTGQAEITYSENSWTVPAKTDFYNFFVKLLSVCDDFVNRISNLENINKPGSAADPKRIAVNWVSVEVDVEYKKFDRTRNDYTKKIIIRPIIYETARPDLRLKIQDGEADATSQESRNQENAATYKLQVLRQENKLLKSYKYLFTGLNDQILNLDMKFDPGTTILAAPRDGMIGDTELATASIVNPTQPVNRDLNTARGLLGVVDQLRDAQKFAGLLKSLTDGQISNLAGSLGITALADIESLKQSIQSGTQQAAQDLAARLSSRTLSQAAQAVDQANADAAAGGAPTPTLPDGSPYDPESSGITYAEDLLTDIMERAGGLTLQQIQDAGLIRASDLGASTFDLEPPVTTDPTVASSGPATSMIARRGSPTNVLFNYMYAKHSTFNTMLAIEMTIRGDPWYLGASKGRSTTTAAALDQSGQPHILLQVATPPPFDLDVRDEDNNTGYWNMNGLSNSMSGVYLINRVVNKFQNGMFTTVINGGKIFDVPLHKIRPLEPGRPSELGGFDLETGAPLTPEENANRNFVRSPQPSTGTDAPGGPAPGTFNGTPNANGFVNPLGNASYTDRGNFGQWRPYYNDGRGGNHQGIDLSAPSGTPIYAGREGTIKLVKLGSASAGNYVVIDHGGGLVTRYLHMRDAPLVREGQRVTTGQPIGVVGSTGRSTGPHLHFEVLQNGRPVDPRPYLQPPAGG